ncbi:F-box only protein 3 isoform X1 [Solea senegalensis]|uniref:F-box only protein 3 isoform X1 n=1 Tax=Solea senegalensis TaxID=28829 RepID=A0AAV6RBZ4_SOLSE|nr:F-box only protein 3 [Solea senegalensis]XP_043907877.1 F-box only protein 3 [Solea senegalensis]KAG7502213.1 F-box only protein 3 isoform X1 [Solea senegalensis]
MAAASSALRVDLLPSDPLLHVFSFLDFRDLVHCSYVSRRLNELSKHNLLWKFLCCKHWLLTDADRVQSGVSWFCLFKQNYKDLGRYIQHYATLRQAWEELKSFLQQRCPRMIASLKEGTTEVELNTMEAQIGCRLPDDYRCSYRIHNGQKLVIPGLMGSMSLSNHYRSEVLLDVETAAGGFQQRKGMRHCLPLTFCFHTGLSQYVALQPAEGRRKFESFYPCPDQTAQDPSAIDMFITGSCFLEWFTTYVHNVVTGEYPIIRDQIFRYVHDSGCVATTGDITVSVSTSFLPELSSVHPPHFFFTYRIRIEMSSGASPDAACQLDSRYWKITTSDGNMEEVQGPGVVGEFPVLTPGKVHEYASCTTFSTPSEYMEGHYTFHRLVNKEEVFQVAIPRFHMVCPPFREPTVRTRKATPTAVPPRCDEGDREDDESGNFGDLRGINMAALEGAWCPRHI